MGELAASLAGINWNGLTTSTIIAALAVLLVCLFAVKILTWAFNKTIEKIPVDRTLHTFLKSALKILLLFLTVLIVADTLHIPVTSLIAVLSVAGLAISLAVQGTLSNLAGGIMVLVSKPFVVGDYIEAGGVSGTVMEIDLVYTKITTPDNKVIFVPNGEISSTKITNYTTTGKRRVDLTICASYQNSIESVKAAINQVLEKNSAIQKDPPAFVNVKSYQSSNIEYVIQVWVNTPDYLPVYFALLEDIKHSFDENGISMAYNQVQMHVVER